MERFDVSEGDRFAEMVSAARAGAEVEIVENGAVVVRLVRVADASSADDGFVARLAELRRRLPPEALGIDWSNAVEEMRSEYRG